MPLNTPIVSSNDGWKVTNYGNWERIVSNLHVDSVNIISDTTNETEMIEDEDIEKDSIIQNGNVENIGNTEENKTQNNAEVPTNTQESKDENNVETPIISQKDKTEKDIDNQTITQETKSENVAEDSTNTRETQTENNVESKMNIQESKTGDTVAIDEKNETLAENINLEYVTN